MPTEIRVHLSVFAHKLSLSRQNYPIRQSPRRFSTGLEARESSGSLHAGSATDTRTGASNEIKPSCAQRRNGTFAISRNDSRILVEGLGHLAYESGKSHLAESARQWRRHHEHAIVDEFVSESRQHSRLRALVLVTGKRFDHFSGGLSKAFYFLTSIR